MRTDPDRAQRIIDLVINDPLLTTWKNMTHDEATWRNENEYKQHCKWAKARRDYMQAEIDDALLPKPGRPAPPPDTPPIVSHRMGRGQNSSTYGEKFG